MWPSLVLRGDAEWGVGRTVAAIAAALHDFEEEAATDRGAIELEEVAVVTAVEEDVVGLQPGDKGVVEAEAGGKVGVVVGRHSQRGEAGGGQRSGGRKDVVGCKRDVLDARAEGFTLCVLSLLSLT